MEARADEAFYTYEEVWISDINIINTCTVNTVAKEHSQELVFLFITTILL